MVLEVDLRSRQQIKPKGFRVIEKLHGLVNSLARFALCCATLNQPILGRVEFEDVANSCFDIHAPPHDIGDSFFLCVGVALWEIILAMTCTKKNDVGSCYPRAWPNLSFLELNAQEFVYARPSRFSWTATSRS